MNIIGYMTLYIKATSCDSIYYAKHSCDFHKPITEHLLQDILNAVAKVYEEVYKQTMMTTEFISQDEYDSNSGLEAKISFQDEGTTTEDMHRLLPTDQWLYEAGIYNADTYQYKNVKQTRKEDEMITWYFANYSTGACNYCIRFRYVATNSNQRNREEESLDLNTLKWLPVNQKR